jgi:hypothetical protein
MSEENWFRKPLEPHAQRWRETGTEKEGELPDQKAAMSE